MLLEKNMKKGLRQEINKSSLFRIEHEDRFISECIRSNFYIEKVRRTSHSSSSRTKLKDLISIAQYLLFINYTNFVMEN